MQFEAIVIINNNKINKYNIINKLFLSLFCVANIYIW